MPNQHDALLRQVIEEQLGEFRVCADLPAKEIDAMAERLARAVAPFVATAPVQQANRAA